MILHLTLPGPIVCSFGGIKQTRIHTGNKYYLATPGLLAAMGNQRTMADANQNLISESIKTMTECKLMQLKCEIESRN